MSVFTTIALLAAEGEPHRDDNGQVVTHHWLLPEQAEIIYGTLASAIIFGLLWKFAWPAIKKGLEGRTAKIQSQLDDGTQAKASAEAEAAQIRQAKGDIEGERARMLADADAEAEALLTDGRARLEAEIAELEARAAADLEAAAGRSGDQLRNEMIRVTGAATERAVAESLDDATQQELIEAFISKVGAS